jgi:hypothetical protein
MCQFHLFKIIWSNKQNWCKLPLSIATITECLSIGISLDLASDFIMQACRVFLKEALLDHYKLLILQLHCAQRP